MLNHNYTDRFRRQLISELGKIIDEKISLEQSYSQLDFSNNGESGTVEVEGKDFLETEAMKGAQEQETYKVTKLEYAMLQELRSIRRIQNDIVEQLHFLADNQDVVFDDMAEMKKIMEEILKYLKKFRKNQVF